MTRSLPSNSLALALALALALPLALAQSCPAGTFGAGGVAPCTPCSGGTFALGGAAACAQGPADGILNCTASLGADTSCTPCPAGSFCPVYTDKGQGPLTNAQQCPAGSRSVAGLGSATECAAAPAERCTVRTLAGGGRPSWWGSGGGAFAPE